MTITTVVPGKGAWLLKAAVVYLLIGLGLGLYMSMTQRFELRAVHTHLNLLGWSTLGLTGAVYCLFPRLGGSRVAAWHFWLHNLGLPVMMAGLAAYHLGYPGAVPFIAAGSLITVLGLVLFAYNLFANLKGDGLSDAA